MLNTGSINVSKTQRISGSSRQTNSRETSETLAYNTSTGYGINTAWNE